MNEWSRWSVVSTQALFDEATIILLRFLSSGQPRFDSSRRHSRRLKFGLYPPVPSSPGGLFAVSIPPGYPLGSRLVVTPCPHRSSSATFSMIVVRVELRLANEPVTEVLVLLLSCCRDEVLLIVLIGFVETFFSNKVFVVSPPVITRQCATASSGSSPG
jgi:hypothetical protein